MKKPLAKLLYGASETDANLLYVTQFFAPDSFLWISISKKEKEKTYGFFSDLEIDRARRTARITHCFSITNFSILKKFAKIKNKDIAALLSFLEEKEIRHLTVPYTFPAGIAELLKKQGLQLSLVKDADLFPERRAKTTLEIKYLKQAQAVAELGMARAKELLQRAKITSNGFLQLNHQRLTSEKIQAEINVALAYAGAVGVHTIVAGGEQACDPHERGYGPLRANELIIVDIFPRVIKSGYWGDITRTFVRGKASESQQKLYQTVLTGQKRALQQLHDNCDGIKIQQDIRNFFTEQGYPTEIRKKRHVGFFHGLGHGVGLEIHESPRFGSGKLRKNDAITVEPGLYYPGLGGVRVEDLVVIEKTGYQNLTRFSKNLVL
ncbi:MAG: Xaa-Pro peptidase family protein [Verrucomicrobiae bacterium]|nr:Xaa-Pro peptidase family protein [Verrucomicrobiae bacterium]